MTAFNCRSIESEEMGYMSIDRSTATNTSNRLLNHPRSSLLLKVVYQRTGNSCRCIGKDEKLCTLREMFDGWQLDQAIIEEMCKVRVR